MRTAELKAAIIRNQTGRNVSPATIKRQSRPREGSNRASPRTGGPRR
ncbi:MAG: hypothetical protein ACLSVD_02515 [Eggerthellaceae bacterium]